MQRTNPVLATGFTQVVDVFITAILHDSYAFNDPQLPCIYDEQSDLRECSAWTPGTLHKAEKRHSGKFPRKKVNLATATVEDSQQNVWNLEDITIGSKDDWDTDDIDAPRVELNQKLKEAKHAQTFVSILMQEIIIPTRVNISFLEAQSTPNSPLPVRLSREKRSTVPKSEVSAETWCSAHNNPIRKVCRSARSRGWKFTSFEYNRPPRWTSISRTGKSMNPSRATRAMMTLTI